MPTNSRPSQRRTPPGKTFCVVGLLGLWTFCAYKIYCAASYGLIWPRMRFGGGWFSYADDPGLYVSLVAINGFVVAAPVLLILVWTLIRKGEERRRHDDASKPVADVRPRPIMLHETER